MPPVQNRNGLQSPPASRFECRLALELALEARFPRLMIRKPVFGGTPIDMYLLLQAAIACNCMHAFHCSYSMLLHAAAAACSCCICDCIFIYSC